MRSSHSLDRLDAAFDDDATGGRRRAPAAGHAGRSTSASRSSSSGTSTSAQARPGERRRQAPDARHVGARGWRLHRRRGRPARGRHGAGPGLQRSKAASTLGTFLRSFRWGHVRQLDRVSRELLARAWAAGAGPGSAPFTIDLDSTICETYGLAEGGRRSTTATPTSAAITRCSRSPPARATC